MRQVFSSARLDNVEGVAKMLEDEGIEVRITQGRSYKGSWQGRRTYRETSRDEPLPAVWVVKSEDQPRARHLLREAGLLASTRMPSDSYLGPSLHADAAIRAPATPQRRAFRYKMLLLGAIAVALVLTFATARRTRAPAPAATPATVPSVAPVATPAPRAVAKTQVPTAYRVDTPPALAELLVATEAQALGASEICVVVDGRPVVGDLAASLRARGLRIDPATCAGARRVPTFDVRDYLTDGSGTGTVRVRILSMGPDDRPRDATRVLEVQREGMQWRVLRLVETR
jgi:hypothetical protein